MSDQLIELLEVDLYVLYYQILIIVLISTLYFFGDICRLIGMYKMNRRVELFTFNNFIDFVLFVCALVYVNFYYTYVDGSRPTTDVKLVYFLQQTIIVGEIILEFDFFYLFATILGCMTLKIIYIFGFNRYLGALQEIVIKMMKDFMNFLIIFLIICIMFTLMGHFWFCIYAPA